MHIPDAIAELGLLMKQTDLALNEEGCCTLHVDGRLTVDIQLLPDSQTLHFSSVVSLTSLANDDTLAAMLRANMIPAMTGGAQFSAGPEREILFEQRIEMEGIDFATFSSKVETFFNYLDGWEDALAGGELPSF